MPEKTAHELPTDHQLAARVASRVRTGRLAAELTQAQLAHRMGHRDSHIAQIEGGSRLPTLRTILSLCRALDCPLSALLAERDAPWDVVQADAVLPATPGEPGRPPKSEPPTEGSMGGGQGDLSPIPKVSGTRHRQGISDVSSDLSKAGEGGGCPESIRRMFGG